MDRIGFDQLNREKGEGKKKKQMEICWVWTITEESTEDGDKGGQTGVHINGFNVD